jgi:hypothetical protein
MLSLRWSNHDCVAQNSGTGAAVARAREEVHARWDGIQVGFVGERCRAVREVVALVSVPIKWLAEIFAQEHQKPEQRWDRRENGSSEDLRVALQRFRSFFARPLAS